MDKIETKLKLHECYESYWVYGILKIYNAYLVLKILNSIKSKIIFTKKKDYYEVRISSVKKIDDTIIKWILITSI